MSAGQPLEKRCASVEWFTPPHILERVRAYFGLRSGRAQIDLDPATSMVNPAGAATFFVAPGEAGGNQSIEDGLSKLWAMVGPNIFVNPPYGRGTQRWTAKIAETARYPMPTRIVALLPSNRFETAYVQEHLLRSRELRAIVLIRKRLTFVDEHGERILDPKTYGSLLWIFDSARGGAAFLDAALTFAPIGAVLRVTDVAGRPSS